MLRTFSAVAASLALLGACQSTPKDDNALVIEVGEDGQMRVVSADDSPEGVAIAQMLQLALDGELDLEDEPPPLSEDEVWHEDAAGNLTHIQSGAQCPARWGEYARERTAIYAPDGANVGCNYTASGGRIQTFYVYQNDQSLADELEETFVTMQTRQPVSEEVPFANSMAFGRYVARALAYSAADGTRMRTSVLLADSGGWRLKIRLTCKATDVPSAETAAGVGLIGQADRLASPRQPLTASPAPV
jgi:hypothetical protein